MDNTLPIEAPPAAIATNRLQIHLPQPQHDPADQAQECECDTNFSLFEPPAINGEFLNLYIDTQHSLHPNSDSESESSDKKSESSEPEAPPPLKRGQGRPRSSGKAATTQRSTAMTLAYKKGSGRAPRMKAEPQVKEKGKLSESE